MNLENKVGNSVFYSVDDSIGNSIGKSIWSSVSVPARKSIVSVCGSTRYYLRDSVRDSINSKLNDYDSNK